LICRIHSPSGFLAGSTPDEMKFLIGGFCENRPSQHAMRRGSWVSGSSAWIDCAMKTQGSEADATTASKVMPASIGARSELKATKAPLSMSTAPISNCGSARAASRTSCDRRPRASGSKRSSGSSRASKVVRSSVRGASRCPRPGRDPGAGSEPRPQVVFDRGLARLQPFALARAIGHALLSKT